MDGESGRADGGGPRPARRTLLATLALLWGVGGCGEDEPAGPSLDDALPGDLSSQTVLQPFGVWNAVWPGYHLAVDLEGSGGTPVAAMDRGTVRHALTGVSGYGGVVVVEHPSGAGTILAIYGHLSARDGLAVDEGEEVERGQLLGRLAHDDEDGGPWEPHLHFGLRAGPHREGPQLCGVWLYVGYTRECPGTTHEAFLAAGWLDPLREGLRP